MIHIHQACKHGLKNQLIGSHHIMGGHPCHPRLIHWHFHESTPWKTKRNLKKNQLFEKKNHVNQTSIFWVPAVNFQGVFFCWLPAKLHHFPKVWGENNTFFDRHHIDDKWFINGDSWYLPDILLDLVKHQADIWIHHLALFSALHRFLQGAKGTRWLWQRSQMGMTCKTATRSVERNWTLP